MSRKKMRDLVRSWCCVLVITVLLVDPSVEQGSGSSVQSFRGSLLSLRGQTESEPQQQVILPRGFQQQQRIQTPSNVAPVGSYETRGISRVIPSIQNGHFQLRPRGASVPFGSDRNSGGFSPLLNLTPAGNSRSSQQTSAANEARYEYYDDNDDIIYHYSNEDGTPESSSSSSSSSGASSSSRGASIPTKSAASVRGSGSLSSRVVSKPPPLIPLVDEDERGVSLRGRSVQGQQSPRNSAFSPPHNPTPLPGLIRNPSIYSKGLGGSSTAPPTPPVTTTKRPAILRGPVNRFTLSSRPSRPVFRPVETNPVRKSDISSSPLDSANNRVSDSQKDNDSEGEYEYEEQEYYEEDEQESEDKAKVPETKTKVTVSVSTKTSSTTPAPSSTLGPGIVISVATTRSVSDRIPVRTSTPAPVTTPKVTFSRATGSSIVVASVQTSRSVASPGPLAPLQRLINSQQAAQAKSNPEPEYVEEEYAYPDNYPVTNGTSLVDGQPTASSSKTVTQESVMDKLDYLQSELTNGLFTGLHSHASVPSTTTQNSVPLTSSTSTSESTTAAVSTPSGVSNQDTQALNVEHLFKSIKFKEADLSHLLPPGYVPSSPPTTTTTTTTEATTTTSTTSTTTTLPPPTTKSAGIVFETVNIGSLLPKGYRISLTQPILTTVAPISSTTQAPTTTATATTPRGLESLLSKVKMSDISALLPPGYDESRFTSSTSPPPPSSSPANVESSTSGLEALVPNIKFDDVSKFLPPGFSASPAPKPVYTSTAATAATADPTTAKQNLNKLVFPTRPGGLKATRPSTTERPAPEEPTLLKVTIMKGPPTRKTTEFTGWPTPSTTPMPSTSSTSTTTESTTTTTTTTTPRSTTTPIPPKRSALSACSNPLCKMEAVLRIVGHRWKPEYTDINTDEWKHLEKTVKRELDAAYRSSGLAQYYRSVEIEGFTRGSVIVDYFVLLENVTTNLTSADVRALFHASLPPSDFRHEDAENPEGDHRLLPADERLRLGRYTIDPKYTDFKVRNVTTETVGASASEALIPQWGIAVIVIGLASLMFVVVFGVTVLVNKHRNSKKKNTVSLTQEMLSEFNKTHSYGVDNYGADDLYNMDDVWNDKHQPQHHPPSHMDRTFDRKPKRGSSSGKGSVNYNIYDSWKTEWNGQYFNGNGNYYGDSGYAPSRRRSDYDTNF